MAKINVPRTPITTHEGGRAKHINSEMQLRRSVMSCLLWERDFYENGEDIASRITSLIPKVFPEKVAAMAVEARGRMKLRHVPLLIVREMARLDSHKGFVGQTLAEIIQRPDELAEFVAIYWQGGRCPLSAQVKKGLARAFNKFGEYALAKWSRKDSAIKLRDVLFLCHAKPKDQEQEALWKRLIGDELVVPDTWEVALSSGGDKKAHWERLLRENKLGALVLLRNLRNFQQVGVDESLIETALAEMRTERVLPFRFLVAAKYAPDFEPVIEQAFFRCCSQQKKLSGKTILIVDVSGSMYGASISKYSEMDRAKAACSLAVLIRELCEKPFIYATAGNDYSRIHATKKVPPRRGFALSDAVYGLCNPLGGGGIFLKQVMDYIFEQEKSADRIIVITDEQDCSMGSADSPAKAKMFGGEHYMINVASAKNGIGYGPWIHIDGFSEAVVNCIQELEGGNLN